MRQTPQQIRIGGFAALGIGILNLLIFGVLALAKHNGLFFFAALPSVLIVAALGILYLTQAERLAASASTQKIPKKVRAEAASKGVAPHSLRTAGSILTWTGAGLFVVFLILAVVTQKWSFLFTTVAPALIIFSMGMLFVATDRPTAH